MHYLERVRIAEHANKVSRADIRWSAAACGYRPFTVHETENYAVDEPTSALDPEMVKEVTGYHDWVGPIRDDHVVRNT